MPEHLHDLVNEWTGTDQPVDADAETDELTDLTKAELLERYPGDDVRHSMSKAEIQAAIRARE